MKTTLDIPVGTLEEVIARTGATTKRDAVVIALTEWVRQKRLNELAAELGTFDDVISLEELLRQRALE